MLMNHVNVVNPFEKTYVSSNKDNKIIHNLYEASLYMGEVCDDTKLEYHVDSHLKQDKNFKNWRNNVPSKTPAGLLKYKNDYVSHSESHNNILILNEAQKDIVDYGIFLPLGQQLVHGGVWKSNTDSLVLDSPLSTSFNPQVALRLAERNKYCFCNKKIDLLVLNVISPDVIAFPFSITRGKHKNEDEVVIQAGAKLIIRKKCTVNSRKNKICGEINKNNWNVNVLYVDVDSPT